MTNEGTNFTGLSLWYLCPKEPSWSQANSAELYWIRLKFQLPATVFMGEMRFLLISLYLYQWGCNSESSKGDRTLLFILKSLTFLVEHLGVHLDVLDLHLMIYPLVHWLITPVHYSILNFTWTTLFSIMWLLPVFRFGCSPSSPCALLQVISTLFYASICHFDST